MTLRMIQLGIWWSDGRPRPSSRAGTPGSPPAAIKIARHGALLTALIIALALSSPARQIVDPVVTSVNGHVALQSDWERAAALEAFSDARDPDSLTMIER